MIPWKQEFENSTSWRENSDSCNYYSEVALAVWQFYKQTNKQTNKQTIKQTQETKKELDSKKWLF